MSTTTLNPNMEELRLILPSEDIKLFKDLVKKFGWKIGRKKKSGMEEAMDDIKHGRVSEVGDIDEYFRKLGVK